MVTEPSKTLTSAEECATQAQSRHTPCPFRLTIDSDSDIPVAGGFELRPKLRRQFGRLSQTCGLTVSSPDRTIKDLNTRNLTAESSPRVSHSTLRSCHKLLAVSFRSLDVSLDWTNSTETTLHWVDEALAHLKSDDSTAACSELEVKIANVQKTSACLRSYLCANSFAKTARLYPLLVTAGDHGRSTWMLGSLFHCMVIDTYSWLWVIPVTYWTILKPRLWSVSHTKCHASLLDPWATSLVTRRQTQPAFLRQPCHASPATVATSDACGDGQAPFVGFAVGRLNCYLSTSELRNLAFLPARKSFRQIYLTHSTKFAEGSFTLVFITNKMVSPDQTAPPSPPSSDGERVTSTTARSSNQARTTRNGRPMPRPIQAVGDVPGFPPKGAAIPGNLTCKQVCEQYPNGLFGNILDPFIHHNWASTQIYEALPQGAKDWMTMNHKEGAGSKNPANALTKRLQKRREKLIREGTYDALMHSTNIRPEGQGANFQATGRFPTPVAAPAPVAAPNNQPAAVPAVAPRAPVSFGLAPRPAGPVVAPRAQVGYDIAPRSADPPVDPRAPMGYGLAYGPVVPLDRPGAPLGDEVGPGPAVDMPLAQSGPANLSPEEPWDNGRSVDEAFERWGKVPEPQVDDNNANHDAHHFAPSPNYGGAPVDPAFEHPTLFAPPVGNPYQQPAVPQTWAEAAAEADARHYGLPPPPRPQVAYYQPGEFGTEFDFQAVADWDDFEWDFKDEFKEEPGFGRYR